MDINLFDEALEYEFTQVNGLTLKHMQLDAGQLKRGMPLTIWPASYVLAEYLIAHLPANSHVIELGTGTGLVGLSISKQRPDVHVTITDGDDTSLELVSENAEANGCKPQILKLSWGSASAELLNQFDFVVGSDVIYGSEAVKPLLTTVSQLMKPGGEAYLANFKHRYNMHEARVLATAAELSLQPTDLELDSEIRLIKLIH
mmetsp:Transcript_1182/g.2882  ORF Transcript_1182/g.2882 Transcript_1182/m.2882 type:complete len:202 (+) Transcript_1182:1033-1638(+)